MTIPTTLKIMFTVLDEQVEQDDWVPQSPFSPPREAKQNIDPRLAEMGRYSGGGGGGRGYGGRGGYRGGRGGGGGGGGSSTASNAAPLGRSRW
ncbi:ATP-dependent RNA helicase dbp2 [Exophiala xenobiotica]